MGIKDYVGRGLATLALTGSLLFSGCSDNLSQSRRLEQKYFAPLERNLVEVLAGEVGYAEGRSLRSEGFQSCTALILDAGNYAVMAHSLPATEYEGDSFFSAKPEGSTRAENVVERAVRELEKNGIEPGKYWAIVHAGQESAYKHILDDLKRRGIPVRLANLDKETVARIRDIDYNPMDDEMTVSGAFGEEKYVISPTEK